MGRVIWKFSESLLGHLLYLCLSPSRSRCQPPLLLQAGFYPESLLLGMRTSKQGPSRYR